MARSGKSSKDEAAAPERRRAAAPAAAEDKASLRQRASQRMMKIGFLRRRYVKRLLRYLDTSKAKGRRLTPEMLDLQRYLAQVPKQERAERLEQAILSQGNEEEQYNRDLRRAAANQQRRSGKGAGGYRPGAPPRSMVPGPRPPKKPR